MKFQLMSDLHLEFHKNFEDRLPSLKTDADYLILAGDICEARNVEKFGWFFKWCSENYKKTYYTFGNHESYSSPKEIEPDINRALISIDVVRRIKELGVTNFKYLDEDKYSDLGDIIILGATTWTNYDKENPMSMLLCDRLTNDRKAGNLPAEYQLSMHKKIMEYFKDVVSKNPNKKIVLVTHHPITRRCQHPHFKTSNINGGFHSDYDDWILDNPQIKAVCSGHTHHKFDTMIGSTRYIINPLGYRSDAEYPIVTFTI